MMNRERKWTPGPWGGQTIAICGQDLAGLNFSFINTSHKGRYEEGLANARLMKSAPNLVAALEDLLERFESEIHNEYDGTSMLEDRLREADKAREALALAYGETK